MNRTDAIPPEAFLPPFDWTDKSLDITDPATMRRGMEAVKLEARKRDMVQVRALLAAGWKYELPDSPDSEPMSWYWRRPPRRKGSKGMFFWSTNQAYNAMVKEAQRISAKGGQE